MSITTAIVSTIELVRQLLDPSLHGRLTALVAAFRRPEHSYENISLRFALTIEDSKGRRATLLREQEVRFLTSEAGVVRDLVWGEGEREVGYRASGARTVARRKEGMTNVVWLGLPAKPVAGEKAVVRSTRRIVDGLRADEEYLEVRVERPTERLNMRVVFPRERPPKVISLAGEGPRKRLQLRPRFMPDGRAVVSWRTNEVKSRETHRIRWTW